MPDPTAPSPRVAVVTGAGSGIGRAVAVALVEHGWTVVLAGRKAEPLADVVRTAGDRTVAMPADVTNEAAVDRLFAAVRERFGRIDLLFNNAGTFGPAARIDEVTLADWQATVDVNLTAAFLCTRAAFRLMREQHPQGGRIINNGSVAAQRPRPYSAAYGATKHGLSGLTKVTALDGRPFNIVCGQIDVGNAATDMTQRMATGILQPDGTTRPEARMDVAHAAAAVLFMAHLPLDATVQELTILPSAMPFMGRG